MRKAGLRMLGMVAGGMLAACVRTAFADASAPLRLQMTAGLTALPMPEVSAPPVTQDSTAPEPPQAPLTLRLVRAVMEPSQSDPDDDDNIPDLPRPVLPERERRVRDDAAEPAKEGGKLAKTPASNGQKGMFGMGLAPVRWGGYSEDVYRISKIDQGPPSFDHSQRVDLKADSYVWQPWLATVSGNVGFARGVQDSGESVSSKHNSITGAGSVTIFPQSRFPFTASYSATDSTTSSSISDNGSRSERLSLTQQYRPKNSSAVFSASYDNSTIHDHIGGDDSVENMRGSYSDTIGKHSVTVDLNRTETHRLHDKEGLQLYSINASDSYNPNPGLSVNSGVNIAKSDLQQLQNVLSTVSDQTNSRYVQANSSVNWHPREDWPLNLSAGVNFFDAQSQVNGEPNDTQSLSGNVGASYYINPTPNLGVGLNGSLMTINTTINGEKTQRLYSTESGSANYTGNPLTLGNYSYNWNANATVTNQYSDNVSSRVYTAGIAHNLNRIIRLSEISSLNIGANQSLTTHWGSDAEQNSTLSSSANLGWQFSAKNNSTGSISLSANDTRTMGMQSTDNQFINLAGSLNIQLNLHSSLSGSANLQWNRQGAKQIEGEVPTSSVYSTASINYQNSRAFGVNNLRYSAAVNMNAQQSDTRLLGNAAANANPVGYSLDQHLDYNLGRIDIGATATYTYQSGKENALLFLHIGRTFGNY